MWRQLRRVLFTAFRETAEQATHLLLRVDPFPVAENLDVKCANLVTKVYEGCVCRRRSLFSGLVLPTPPPADLVLGTKDVPWPGRISPSASYMV